MLLQPRGACRTCCGAHVCMLKCHPCPRHAQGRAMVPLGAVKAFPWCSLLESPYPSLKSNTGRFHCFWRRHQYVWGDIIEYLNKYKINQIPKISLCTNSIAQVPVRCLFGTPLVRVWLARGARAVRVWLACSARLARSQCARSARLARPWCALCAHLARPRSPHLAPGVWTTKPLGFPCFLPRLSWVQCLPMRPIFFGFKSSG